MRTTVTLDPDVERMIRQVMKERSITFKEALNEAARSGLRGGSPGGSKRFTQKTYRMGGHREIRWDKALAVADAMEDEEISRKLAMRK
ncbi:MAG TPA: hypothetical protein PLF84_14010 [Bryobacteraceae bacterium]|jgi:hypothetical protein|nr:hypothetical protein [Bryobacteraceae bacterium]